MNYATAIILPAAAALAGYAILFIWGMAIKGFAAETPMAMVNSALCTAFAFGLRWAASLMPADRPGPAKLMRHVWKLPLLAAGAFLVAHSMELRHLNNYPGAALFLPFGLALVFLYFFINDEQAPLGLISVPAYRREKPALIAGRALVALLLVFTGTFFILRNMVPLATVAFLAALLQLALLFRFNGIALPGAVTPAPAAAVKAKRSKKQEPVPAVAPAVPVWDRLKNPAAGMMIIAAGFFYYLSLTSLQQWKLGESIILFLAGSVLFGLAPAGASYRPIDPADDKNNAFDWAFCAFILLLGAVVFGFDMMNNPPGIHGDEMIGIDLAKRFNRGDNTPVFLESPQFQVTALHYWLIAVAGKVFGTTINTGRGLSVAVAAVSMPFFYLLVKMLYNRRAAVLSSLLLSFFFMQVFYARNSMSWIWVPAMAVIAYYFFFAGIKKGNPVYFALSGTMLSLNLYMYSAAKSAPVAIFFFAVFMFLRRDTRKEILANWKGFVIMAASMVLMFVPVLHYIITNPGKYFQRMGGMSYIKHFPLQPADWQNLLDTVTSNIQMFMTQSAPSYCHNLPYVPFFDWLTAFCALAGAGYLLYTWKRESSSFTILWLLFGLLPGFLSRLGPEDPYPARTVLAIPVVVLTAALGAERLVWKAQSLAEKYLKPAAFLAMAYFLAWFCFFNINNYFILFPADPHTRTYYRQVDKMMYEYMRKRPNTWGFATTYLTSNYYYGRTPDYSGNMMKQEDISLFEFERYFPDQGTNVAILGEGIYHNSFEMYKEYFPHAETYTEWDRYWWLNFKESPMKYCYDWKYPDRTMDMHKYYRWFYIYDTKERIGAFSAAYIPWEDIDAGYSLEAAYYARGAKTGAERVMPTNLSVPQDADTAVITGLLEVPEYNTYRITVAGAQATVLVDGRPAATPALLYKGLHRIRITLKGAGSRGELRWQYGQYGETRLERRYCLNSDKIFGLMASYYQEGKLAYREMEPVIDYRLYWATHRPARRATGKNGFDIVWDGYITMDKPGKYDFSFDSKFYADVYVDGRLVFSKKEDDPGKGSTVSLAAGPHQIKVKAYMFYISNYVDEGSALRLMFKESGNRAFAPVKYHMLHPDR